MNRISIALGSLALGWLLLSPGPAIAAETEEGFKPIFDGKTLDGWDGNPKFWRVEDGAITGETTAATPTEHNTFLIWRQGKVDDFELRLEYRIRNHNSGIQYRSEESPDWVVGGYQGDMVFDAPDAPYSGILYEERGRGILATRGQKVVVGDDHKPKVVGSLGDPNELASAIKSGDWNSYTIIARGYHLIHQINGKTMSETTDEDKAKRCRSGIVALQLHAGPAMKVQFRNVRLKRLPMEDKKKIVIIAGPKSHGYAAHEHNAGCLLLGKWLNENVPGVQAAVYLNGWPKDPTALDNADAIVLFADGYGANPLNGHLDEVDKLMKRGVGLSVLHYATGLPKGDEGNRLLDWIGGLFEQNWSVNPTWNAEFKALPDHPITRGVKPFAIEDEWYYNMRFPENMAGVTPILVAIPPDATRQGPDGEYSGNAHVRSRLGQPEYLGWVRARPDGGRGFGFTGGHWQANWADDNFRKVVLNAIVWTAKLDVPPDGVPSKRPTLEELEANQDYPKPKDYDNQREKAILAK
ncbi:MAG: DUF1080 domain-containing protein [Planctomycetia bacterium]|nr:DUF1080 domain-containing protein [Planctomycetia bacterium]